jgi:pimeloyl-ACP methyl ester carboxylesterase
MTFSTLARSATYCLSAALLLTVATGADTFAAPPDHARGKGKPVAKRILQIESQGARAFGGTNLFNPAVPSGSRYLPCDHGYVDWQIPPRARRHSLVFTHGSGTRGYQTTFDGQPGFQSIFLGERYPVYLVDFPRTGRAGQGCASYTYTPNLNYTSVFQNRIGLWPIDQPQPTYFPGVAFSRDAEALNQFFRVQYPEFNTPENEQLESSALAVLLEEIYAEGRGKSIVFSHSSGGVRGFRTGTKTDKIAGHVSFEPANAFFPEGEEPMIRLANGSLVPAANSPSVPVEEFRKLAKYPHVIIWGDNIPSEVDPASTTEPALSVRVERFKLMAAAINKYGGNAINLYLPEEGVFGNTHYPFADTNHTEVADQIEQWMKKQKLDK